MFDDEDGCFSASCTVHTAPEVSVLKPSESADVSRFTFDQVDVDSIANRKKPASTEGTGQPSKFLNSIALALALRDDRSLEAVSRKLKRDREAERHCPELVERDLSVGVFVTSAYRRLISKKTSRHEQSPCAEFSSDEDTDEQQEGSVIDKESYYNNILSSSVAESHPSPIGQPPDTTQKCAASIGGDADLVACSTTSAARSQHDVFSAASLLEQRSDILKRRRRERTISRLLDGSFVEAARERFLERKRIQHNCR
jgi:hypothetical protein